ncbi:MAG: tetratricopeptide repeat protein, partial [Parachlamydiaceae bacterium]
MVNLPQDYFRPLNQLIHGNYKEIKCDPITALVMASYLTLIVPAAFLMLNCLKGRINREASEKAKKVNEAALKAMEEEKARKLISDGDAYMGNHDYFKAFECYKKAAELNSSEGHHSLGYCYDTGKGINQDYALAIKHYLLSQDQYESCYNLGYLYENGLGCEKSYEKAAEFYEKAMKMGDKEARLALANLYELGLGVEKDEKKAFDLVDPIANFMYPEADVRLGRYYYDGIGCKADYSQALNIFRYHAKHPDACYYHGLMHLEGRGVQKDEKMAFELFNKAKALGCVQASLRLARMYYEGIGIEPNPEMAFKVISDAHHES